MDLDISYPSIADLRARARKRIPHFVFEYLDSATGAENQHRRNMDDFTPIRFWPEILKGQMECDLTTSFLGRDYPLPFGCAPVGMSGIMWPITWRNATGAGCRALRMEFSGAEISNGAKDAALFGISGAMAHFRA